MLTRIFGACFLGATIGSAVALQLSPFFWWLGLIVGALVGYLGYEFKQVLGAIPKAWQAATGWRPQPGWVSRLLWSGAIIVATLSAVAVMGHYGHGNLFPVINELLSEETSADTPLWLTPIILAAGFIIPVFLTISVFGVAYIGQTLRRQSDPLDDEFSDLDGKACLKYLLLVNPVVAYFLPYALLGALALTAAAVMIGLAAVVTGIVLFVVCAAAVVLYRFAENLFYLIHSDMRLLCASDAALGTAAGYALGQPLLGGLIGGLLGVANYYFVSVRWLKLVPAKQAES